MFFTNENYMCNSPCCWSAKHLSCARDEFKSFLHLDPAPNPHISTVFFSCKFCRQPRLILGVPGLGCTSSTYMFDFLHLVIPPALPDIISVQKKTKTHLCDVAARVQECRVHKVLPSKQVRLCSCCCFSLAKQNRLWSPKQRG